MFILAVVFFGNTTLAKIGIVDNASVLSSKDVRLGIHLIKEIKNYHNVSIVIETTREIPKDPKHWDQFINNRIKSHQIDDLGLYVLIRPQPKIVLSKLGESLTSKKILSKEQLEIYLNHFSENNKINGLDFALLGFLSKLKDSFKRPPPVRSGKLSQLGLFIFWISLATFLLWVFLTVFDRVSIEWWRKLNNSKKDRFGILCTLCCLAGWLIAHYPVYLDPHWLLPRDNYRGSFLMFSYIAEYLRYLGEFPSWIFNAEGGVWVEPYANNYLSLLPHHWIGYLLAKSTTLPINFIYKLCFFVLGQPIFLLGLYLLTKKLFHSTLSACLSVLIFSFSSGILSQLHQEQDLATLLYLPYLWLCLLAMRNHPIWLSLFLALLGQALLSHYPQLLVGYSYTVIASFFIVFRLQWIEQLKHFALKKRYQLALAIGVIAFFITASPAFFNYFTFQDKLVSSFRGQSESIKIQTYEDYTKMQAIRYTSAFPTDLMLLWQGETHPKANIRSHLDENSFFFTPTLVFLFFLVFAYPNRRVSFHAIVGALCAFLCLGIHSGAPRALWHILPAANMFRQWYHFFPFLLFHLLFILLWYCRPIFARSSPSNSRTAPIVGTFLFAILALTRVLTPLYSLPAALLCSLLANRNPKYRSLFSTLLISWAVLGSLPWAFSTLRQYHAWTNANRLTTPIDSRSYTRSLFFEGRPFFSIASPKGLKRNLVKQLGEKSLMYWNTDRGWIPVREEQLWVQNNSAHSFQFQILNPPPRTEDLVVLQHNDGNWGISQGHFIPNSLGVVQIPVTNLREFTLKRKPSTWNTLIHFSWLFPSLIVLALIAARLSSLFQREIKIPSFGTVRNS